MRCGLLLAAGLVCVVPVPSSADWPQERHDAAHSGYTPEEVRPPLELRWKFADIPEPDPDTLPAEAAAYLEALERSGDLKYLAVVPAPGRRSAGVQGHGALHLLAAGDALFVRRDISGTACLDRETGEVRWRREPSCHRLAAIEDDTLVLFNPPRATGDCRRLELAGCHAATGEVTWLLTERELPPAPYSVDGRVIGYQLASPAVCQGRVGICVFERQGDPIGPYIHLVDVRDGSLIDRNPCLSAEAPVDRHGVSCYTGVGFEIRAWGRHFMLLGVSGGVAHYTFPWALDSGGEVTAVWPRDATRAIFGYPLDGHTPLDRRQLKATASIPHGTVLAEELGIALWFERRPAPSRLTARDPATGEWLWSVPLRCGHNGRYLPVVDRRSIYLGLADGVVYALDPYSGATMWETRVGPPLPASKQRSPASFAPICSLAGDTLWVVYCGKLAALQAETGELLWETEETDATWCEPVVAGGFVYLATCRGVEAWGPPTGRDDEAEEGNAGAPEADGAGEG